MRAPPWVAGWFASSTARSWLRGTIAVRALPGGYRLDHRHRDQAIRELGSAPREIQFKTGDAAPLVVARDGIGPEALLRALGLEATAGRPVIVVSGGADDLQGEALARAEELLGPAVATAAELTGAAVVDGGTAVGVMALMGATRAERESALPVLLGVAPAGRSRCPTEARRLGTASRSSRTTPTSSSPTAPSGAARPRCCSTWPQRSPARRRS